MSEKSGDATLTTRSSRPSSAAMRRNTRLDLRVVGVVAGERDRPPAGGLDLRDRALEARELPGHVVERAGVTYVSAPAAATSSAMPLPMFLLAPVTSATRPASDAPMSCLISST